MATIQEQVKLCRGKPFTMLDDPRGPKCSVCGDVPDTWKELGVE